MFEIEIWDGPFGQRWEMGDGGCKCWCRNGRIEYYSVTSFGHSFCMICYGYSDGIDR